MAETVLTMIHGVALLAFGFTLTAAFAGTWPTKRNVLIYLAMFAFSGGMQLVTMFTVSEDTVWKIYPLITHFPLILLLCLVYQKPVTSAMGAVFTAYLCCQPSKWFGVFTYQLTHSEIAELVVRILVLALVGYWILVYASSYLAEIFSKDRRSVCIFGAVPTVYYFFDYTTAVYTDLLLSSKQVVAEFLPFILSVMYMVFCVLYYKEYEQKADAQQKEQIIRIAIDQQAKEIAAVKQAEQEIHFLRHDMRMFLSRLAIAIENGEMEAAHIMINSQVSQIDKTKLVRYCSNDILNYVISDYAARCKKRSVDFSCTVKVDELGVDEIMFASILSNALDNALDAQKVIVPEKRSIKLMIQHSGGKLLMAVKNTVGRQVLFSDGLPVSIPDRHGYGTQSIRYLTEKLGGNCQFSTQDDAFILRVVL